MDQCKLNFIPKERQFVHLRWVDSNFSHGWWSQNKQTAELPHILSAGFVTFCDDEMLEITGSLGEDGAKLNPLTIPWSSILQCEIAEGPFDED